MFNKKIPQNGPRNELINDTYNTSSIYDII